MHQTIKYPVQASKSTWKQALDVLSILVNLTIIAISLLILQELRKNTWTRAGSVRYCLHAKRAPSEMLGARFLQGGDYSTFLRASPRGTPLMLRVWRYATAR